MLSHLPLSLQLFLGKSIGFLWYDVFRIRRNIMHENLNRVFPEKSLYEKRQLARFSCQNMGMCLIEYSRFLFYKKDDKWSLNQFEVVGLENLQKALEKKRGVCVLTLHLGNGDLAAAGLSLHGVHLHLITKFFKVEWINEIWFGLREKVGTHFIEPRKSGSKILKALKANEIVVFVQDQFMGPPIGALTSFFGYPTGTAMGLAVMSARFSSPIVPIYTFRKPNGKHCIVIEPELVLKDTDAVKLPDQSLEKPEALRGKSKENDENLLRWTQMCNYKLEEIIRKHPDQWLWVHKRWKEYKY